MLYFIKYFTIIICGIYCYKKILNLPCSKKFNYFTFLFSVCLTFITIVFEHSFSYASILILILFSYFYLTQTGKTLPEISMTATIVSFGMSYITFFISVTIISVGATCIFHVSSASYNHALLQSLTAILQLAITPLPFCSKRLKHGMPFLTNKLHSMTLMIVSILLLFTALLLSNANNSHVYIMPFLFIFLLAIFIYLSWKNNITRTYLDKLKEKDITELNFSLAEKDRRIKELEKENKELSKIIHSDNKLIPAMALAVSSFIQDTSALAPASAETGRNLLNELDQMSMHCKGIIHRQDLRCHVIPSTSVVSIDNLLKYIQQKAHKMNIDFDAAVSCDITLLIDKIISENDLNTLLADLLDNALIAVKHSHGHHVLLNIDLIENSYVINIFDSGIPFTKEVLLNLGLKNYTTHKEEGGSGIGLTTSYELIRKHKASLTIDEYAPNSGLYSKKVSVTFNQLQQYTLFTCRDSEDVDFLRQRSDLLIVQKTISTAI